TSSDPALQLIPSGPAQAGPFFYDCSAISTAATRRGGDHPRMPGTALVVVDMVNPLDFPRARSLLRTALPAARRVARRRERLKAGGVPTIFVNDNFSHWREDFRQLVAICSQPGVLGSALVEALPPEQDDYNILKPQHSAFYNTPLEVLLD